MRLAIRIAASAFALHAAAPAPAAADGALGASVGWSEDEQGYGDAANQTLGVWGRLGLGGRVSGQLELQQIRAPFESSKLRSGTALIAIDLLGRGHRLMPVLLAGGGLDRASYLGGGLTMEGRHYEGGLGLEYRAASGLVVGVDARLGGRSIENDAVILDDGGAPEPVGVGAPPLDGPALIVAGIAEGEYRAVRLTVGARF